MRWTTAFFILIFTGFILSVGVYDYNISGKVVHTGSSLIIDPGIVVLYYTLDGRTTGFAYLSDDELENITNLTLEDKLYGKIEINAPVNITADHINYIVDIDSNVEFGPNLIQINTSNLTSLQKPATVYIYNIYLYNPKILQDGVLCEARCRITSYDGRILKFKVNELSRRYSVLGTIIGSGGSSSGGRGSVTPDDDEKEILFDMKTKLTKNVFDIDEDIKATISILNRGDLKNIDVDIYYAIKDTNNNILTSKTEKATIKNKLNLKRSLKLPENVTIGNYIFYSSLSYNGKIYAISTDEFSIKTEEQQIKDIEIPASNNNNLILISLIVVALSIMSIGYYSLLKKMKKN